MKFSTNPAYPVVAWEADWEWYFQSELKLQQGLGTPEDFDIVPHFRDTKPTQQQADYCSRHFVAALRFFETHKADARFEPYMVGGEATALLKNSVLLTLYQFFVVEDNQDDPPLDTFFDRLAQIARDFS